MIEEKSIQFQFEAPFYTIGELSPKTKHIWVVFHGYGQLAKYFSKRFDVLDHSEHYIIVPQGLSRFYLDRKYKNVGASWMTKENREIDIENQFKYLNHVFDQCTKGVDWSSTKLHLFAFSQGGATVGRWINHRRLAFDSLVLWAAGFAHELLGQKMDFLKKGAKIYGVLGKDDPFIQYVNFEEQVMILQETLQRPIDWIEFDGGHEVTREVLEEVVSKIEN